MSIALISIIIPTYNRAHLINETLDSIIAQTFTNWECIIIDDGSTDTTESILSEYCRIDARFQYHQRPENRHSGGNAARNFGFELSKGEFINWFDSDDIMLPNFLEEKIKFFYKDENLDVVFSYGAYFAEDIKKTVVSKPKIDSLSILDYVKSDFYLITHGPLWSRMFLKEKKLFDENRSKLQDTEFHFRMLLEKPNVKFYETNFLFLIRRGDQRMSSKDTLTIKKIEDVFLYHYFTLSQSKFVSISTQKEFITVTQKKSLRGFYDVMAFSNSIKERIGFYLKHFVKLNEIIKINTKSYEAIKKHFVVLIIVLTKKGFKLL